MAGVSAVLATGLLAPRVARASAVVRGLRLGDHGSSTRLVLDLTDRVQWTIFTLAAPSRLVLDLPLAKLDLPAVIQGAGLISGARHGMANEATARVVLDLSGPAVVDKDFLLEPQEGQSWRLVIDLAPTSEATFLAGVGLPTTPAVPNSVTPEPSTRAVVDGPTPFVTPAYRPAPSPDAGLDAATGAPLDLRSGIGGGGGVVQSAALATPMATPEPYAAPDPYAPSGSTDPYLAAAPPAGLAITSRKDDLRVFLADGRLVPVPVGKPLPVSAPTRKPVVVLDPGHGGKDPGAIGASGTYEKNVTLEMGRQLRQALEATGRYKVVMTRDRDTSIRLRERVAKGRHAGADLFISIHADALRDSGVRGLSVYTLSENASDDEAAQLAERENKADILLGMDLSNESPDVANILIDLAQRETKNKSVRFANSLIGQLPADVKKLDKTRRYAGFAVLKAPDVPSVLVEMGFLSNRSDEKLLRTSGYRAKLAAALVRSVDDFFSLRQQRAWRP
jgi:N-acetylmuramoyl-L-alanine amidase